MSEVPTIFALSSAHGRAGVAVIRISGPRAGEALDAIATPRPEPRRAVHRRFRHPSTGEDIDRGIAIWFPAPASFTGEDVAELQTHGGRAVVSATFDALSAMPGLRMAEPGEFARRAFENGKIDLAEAEGLADLIDAETDAQRQQALRQADGVQSQLYERWRTKIIEAQALVEAAIDFSDEGDVSQQVMSQAHELAKILAIEIRTHLNDGHRGEILREGFQVVLAGPPNAGKSSLLNALARRDAAIVSAEAGTTRDVIEVRLDFEGLPIVFSDTAGIRDTDALIEREGIKRSVTRARQADLVIWLVDPETMESKPPPALEVTGGQVLRVINKRDLLSDALQSPVTCDMSISVMTGEGLAGLSRHLAATARVRLKPGEGTAITHARHRLHLEDAHTSLQAFIEGDQSETELGAEELRRAAFAIGRITGRIGVEDILGQIFNRFCIGK